MLKKLLIHTRRSIKVILLILIGTFLVVGTVSYLYKPMYRVVINGEQVGYTENKSKLQTEINAYLEKGDGQNVAFVDVDHLPEYQLCLLKKGIVTNDEEIFEKVKEDGTIYYRYYAILDNQEAKAYVSNFSEAETVVNQLKEKNSSNLEKITIEEKYETENQTYITAEEAVSKLFVETKKVIQTAKTSSTSSKYTATGSVNTAGTTSGGKVDLGISLIKPVSGILSSRFGEGSRLRRSSHTGLDIATASGTPIAAAASGTVTFSGYKGSYGNLIVITHDNGVQTYYGHCSKLYVSAGTTVTQGKTIAAVGSTGNSTGPHLHLEIRVNGIAYNPQNYLY